MFDMNDSIVSIEKFAAFLDGNLPANEMQEISSLVSSDADLQNILEISDRVDDMVEVQINSSTELPEEFQEDLFSLPTIPDIGIPDMGMSGLEEVSCFAELADCSVPDFDLLQEDNEFSSDESNSGYDSSDLTSSCDENITNDLDQIF